MASPRTVLDEDKSAPSIVKKESETESPSVCSRETQKTSNVHLHKKQHQSEPRKPLMRLLRTILLDIPLALLFASFLIVYVLHHLHNVYYVPLFDRAQRTDEDLNEEFTYYNRRCTIYDLSTDNIQDLFVNDSAPVEAAIDQMLTHGAMVVPKVLKEETVQQLRAFIVRRNANVTEAESYPVSQGYHRLSYGIDATEHPAVTRAVKEVANNPLLRSIVQGLLGDPDPASAEITAITAYEGCPDQAWHADTKEEGNAMKFARTYSHSYSLFLPLQNTTAEMGATDMCPGTHYCSGDITEMCESTKMGLHEATPEHVFRAGDGALVNQHVWHRGSTHTDPNAPERIMFIVSFLARPKFGKDPRQLSRGTYFHQKWNMWGHTWKDLADPLFSMRSPYSYLRCMGLWKPANRNWGYDLVTSGFMRFSNGQLEMEDFPDRFLPRLDQWHFPNFLRGTILEEGDEDVTQRDVWQTFLQETVDRTYKFVKECNIGIHALYLLLVVLWSASGGGLRGTFRAMRRLLWTHGILALLAVQLLSHIRHSDWGSSVLSGKTLKRPFPEVQLPHDEEAVMISRGPTTLPQRQDVLLGTRYDAKFLGSYDRWLDFHPGNVLFRQASKERASLYRSGGPVIGNRLLQDVMDLIVAKDGRFLQQDYRTGNWRIMSNDEAVEAIHQELVASSSDVLAAVRREIAYLLADYRFGLFRGTVLARHSQLYLWRLKKQLLCEPIRLPTKAKTARVAWKARKSLAGLSRRTRLVFSSWSLPPSLDKDEFQVGTSVWCYDDDEAISEEFDWFPGTILGIDEDDGSFIIGSEEGFVLEDVSHLHLRKRKPVQEGGRVEGCYDDSLEDCYPGTVLQVMPNGDISIHYDDGDWQMRVPPDRYFLPPFRYMLPKEGDEFEDEELEDEE